MVMENDKVVPGLQVSHSQFVASSSRSSGTKATPSKSPLSAKGLFPYLYKAGLHPINSHSITALKRLTIGIKCLVYTFSTTLEYCEYVICYYGVAPLVRESLFDCDDRRLA